MRLIETAADIARIAIEQQRASQALRHSEARNQAILRAIPDWMFLTTLDGVFLDYHARDAAELHAPPAAFLGRQRPRRAAAARRRARWRRRSPAPPPRTSPRRSNTRSGPTTPSGSTRRASSRCDGDKILSIVRDITDRKRAELEADAHRRELAHLGRVAMLGELSGALAHELSQPLTAVLSNAQAARRLLDRDPLDVEQIREALDDIISNDKRAGAVIDRLRALLRKGEAALQPVDLNEVAREVARPGLRRTAVAPRRGDPAR